MTVEMRKHGEKLGVYLESIRSLCSRIQSTLVEVLEGLQKGSLHSYLECLTKMIERQLCSSTIFSMKYSWRLPKGTYPLEVKKPSSSSSSEEVDQLIRLPMKVLDDLNICEIRAKLRSMIALQAGTTVLEEMGKTWWNKFRGTVIGATKFIFSKHGAILYDIAEEKDVFLTFLTKRRGKEYIIMLHGRVDLAIFFSYQRIPMIVLFEFTLYRDALTTVKDRLLAYASAIYNEYGFPVIPVIVIMTPTSQVTDMYVLVNKGYVVNELKYKISKKLLPITLGEKEPKHVSKDLCHLCDISIKRICPFYHQG